ncbi:MAG: exodeoxyribonuclease III [Spirochaetaceae bacterium]|nr:exodeoxyribonuclease III [Spirochaetaceae bacterium]
MSFISWNVNGLRAALKKGLTETIEKCNVDIFCVQETKMQEHQLTDEMQALNRGQGYWSFSTVKKGYSGVAVFSRIKPLSVKHGFGIEEFDQEGRVLEMDFGDFVLFNIYFPNGQQNDERLDYKLRFYNAFLERARELRSKGKSIIATGDFNTAHNAIDLKNDKANEKYSGFLRIERDWLDKFVADGYVDTFRHFYPTEEKYSWWSYRMNARANNTGWRIDYFFVSQDLINKGYVKKAWIDNDITGSDHCPVGLEIHVNRVNIF